MTVTAAFKRWRRRRLWAAVDRAARVQVWYHTIDLGDGIVTPGMFDHREYLDEYGLPADLSGQRVLDVGTANGFFAFEMERRGARKVVAVDTAHPWSFRLCRRALGSRAAYVRADIHDLTPRRLGGTFDLVFCGDLLLHLDDIVGAMRTLRKLTRGTVIVASALMDGTDESQPLVHAALTRETVTLTRGPARGDQRSFNATWIGNRMFYRRLLEYTGFTDVEIVSTHTLRPVPDHGTDMGHEVRHIVIRGQTT